MTTILRDHCGLLLFSFWGVKWRKVSLNELELQQPLTFSEEAGQTAGVRDVPVATLLFSLSAGKSGTGVIMSEVTVHRRGKSNTCKQTLTLRDINSHMQKELTLT